MTMLSQNQTALLESLTSLRSQILLQVQQGLRADLERLDGDTVSMFIASLKRHGVSDEVIREAMTEVVQ